MGARNFQLRRLLRQKLAHLLQVGDARHHVEALPPAVALAPQRLTDDHRIEGRDVGAHGQPVDRRRGDERQLAHARQGQLQRARDRRGRQSEHVHIVAELLQALLVGDAEMLLLVHHQQPQPLEIDGLAEQRVRAHDDVDVAFLEPGLDRRQLLPRDQPRGLRDAHGQPLEALREGGEVLSREQRRRHHHRHLEAVERSNEGRPQRHLGLAEAHIAAHQPVHRLAGGEIVEHRADAGGLVLRLAIGKTGHELVECALGRRHHRRLAQLPQRRHLDELRGDLADALLETRLARLPGRAAEAIELHLSLGRAVARQQIDILDGQIELGPLGVGDLQTIVRRAQRGDGGEAIETADAMIGMHDEVTWPQARRFRNDVGGLAHPAPRPHQPVAENVLLTNHCEIGRLEPLLQRQHGEGGRVRRQRRRFGEAFDLAGVGEPVLAQQRHEALARALAERRYDYPLALGLQGAHVANRGFEHIALAGALECEVAPDPAAEGAHPAILAISVIPAKRSAEREPRPRHHFGLYRWTPAGRSARPE